MAACKPEELISQLAGQIETRFQGLTPICGVQQLNGTMVHCSRHKGSPYIQDGGLQTASTYISTCRPDRNVIVRANPSYGVQHLNGTMVHCTWHKGSPDIQDVGLQTGSYYISAFKWHRNDIRANPHFRGTGIRRTHLARCSLLAMPVLFQVTKVSVECPLFVTQCQSLDKSHTLVLDYC